MNVTGARHELHRLNDLPCLNVVFDEAWGVTALEDAPTVNKHGVLLQTRGLLNNGAAQNGNGDIRVVRLPHASVGSRR